eukprot:m.933454 g.933454  ORF g.933454 m.933454 type:complete len:188 (+) comp23796_c0_seq1:145-708(+)
MTIPFMQVRSFLSDFVACAMWAVGNHGHYLVRPVTKENRAFVLVVNDSGTICNFMIKAGRLGCSFGGKHYNTMKDAIAAIKSEALQGNFIEDGESLMLTYPAAGGVVLDESTISRSRNNRGSGGSSGTPARNLRFVRAETAPPVPYMSDSPASQRRNVWDTMRCISCAVLCGRRASVATGLRLRVTW